MNNTSANIPSRSHPLLRWLRHLWLDADSVKRQIQPDALKRLEERVRLSETRHRGELRVCVEGGLGWHGLRQKADARSRAIALFSQLRVWDTDQNNGVLIYLLLADRRIEVLADRGLSSQVDAHAWQAMVDDLRVHLQQGHFEAGLTQGIDKVGEWMREFYPLLDPAVDNPNELPNAVIIL